MFWQKLVFGVEFFYNHVQYFNWHMQTLGETRERWEHMQMTPA